MSVLAKRKVLVCVAVLITISGLIYFSGWKSPELQGVKKGVSEDIKMSSFLDLAQENTERIAVNMIQRVHNYLGYYEQYGPSETRPLTADKDPDLDEAAGKNTHNDVDTSGGSETAAESQAESNAESGQELNPDEQADASTGETSETNGQEEANSVSEEVPSPAATSDTSSEENASKENESSSPTSSDSQNTPVNSLETASDNTNTEAQEETSGSSDPELELSQGHAKVPNPTKENTEHSLRFRLYSHNVRSGAAAELEPGEESWELRKQHVINSIKLNAVASTIVCLQESLQFQIDDILNELNRFSSSDEPKWVFSGLGHAKGQAEVAHIPILYMPSEWSVVHVDSVRLNEETPQIASIATLQSKALGQFVNIINTDLDHLDENSRTQSALLLVKLAQSLDKWPLFVLGDMNSTPDETTSRELKEAFKDVHEHVTDAGRYGYSDYSFTGFSSESEANGKRVDYIFAPQYTLAVSGDACKEAGNRKYALQLLGYGLLHSKYEDMYMSDHRPVMADFVMLGCAGSEE